MLKVWMFLGLLWFSWEDFKHRAISSHGAIGFSLGSVVFSYFSGEQTLLSLLMGMLPGIALLLLAFPKKAEVGRGDAVILIAIGSILGLWRSVEVLFVASAFAAVAGVIKMIAFKGSRRDTLPFIPFLALGNAMSLLGASL